MSRKINALIFLFICLFPHQLPAQSHQPLAGDTVDWHTVKEGETLKKITEFYLGDGTLWPENHRLNPSVVDPDLLRIGQRLRVIVAREKRLTQAELIKVVNEVKRRQMPRPWEVAGQGDLLKERDGVRTMPKSTAQLKFEDGTHLNIREDSLLFLKKVERSIKGNPREEVEVISGQVDLQGQLKRPERLDIELVLGDVRSKPGADKYGNLRSRNRLDTEGNAAVMVFGGNAEVSAGGASVTVARGMGTKVKKGAKPDPPRKLLPAPKSLGPGQKAKRAFANPTFTWSAVPGAAKYTWEISKEPNCATPLFRVGNLSEPKYQSIRLPATKLYWRVTATDRNGLDGFPSKPKTITITADTLDRLPPVVVAYPVGRSHVPGPNRIELGKGGRIKLAAQDDGSGVAGVEYRWDDGPWRKYTNQQLNLPRGAEQGVLSCRAQDALGRVSAELSVTVSLIQSPPEKPTLKP